MRIGELSCFNISIFKATFYGHLSVTKMLVESGAKINGFNRIRMSPLFVAVERGHLNVLTYFVECGIKPESKRTDDGKTLLEIARQLGYPHIVNFLSTLSRTIRKKSALTI